MNALDGISVGEACYLAFAMLVALAVGVGLLVAIARAEARSRVGEAERIRELRRDLARPPARSHHVGAGGPS